MVLGVAMNKICELNNEVCLNRLLSINELVKIFGVSRAYFSQNLAKNLVFVKMVPPVFLHEKARPKYWNKDVLKFIDYSRKYN